MMVMVIWRGGGEGGTVKRVPRVGEAGARECQQRRAVEERHNQRVKDDAHPCYLKGGGAGGAASQSEQEGEGGRNEI